MTCILKIGSLFVTGYELAEEEGKKSEVTRISMSKKYAMRLPYDIAKIISDAIDAEVMILEDSPSIEKLNEFLTKRENKLQRIEQLFKSGVVDLEELAKLVKEDK